MHELGLTQEIIAIVTEHSQGARVRRVVLEIGKLTAILPDAIRFCFELCSEGTAAEGACLEIVELPGRARCRACSAEVVLERPYGQCACGCSDLDWLAGDEFKIKDMEVA
jgi:hydrogenase nickel incorporation protein HypA/HybF